MREAADTSDEARTSKSSRAESCARKSTIYYLSRSCLAKCGRFEAPIIDGPTWISGRGQDQQVVTRRVLRAKVNYLLPDKLLSRQMWPIRSTKNRWEQDQQVVARPILRTISDFRGERGTCETVTAGFWPWLLGKCPKTLQVVP